MLPRVLLTSPLEAGVMQRLQTETELVFKADLSHSEWLACLPDCDAAITLLSQRLDAADFARLKGSRLKIVANHAVGFENLALEAASAAQIWVSNTPEVLNRATAEMAWSLLLALSRRVLEGDRLVRSGQWQGWEPTQLLGQGLFGKTLGIVGAGRIGQTMAHLGSGFGLNLLYFSRQRKLEFEATSGAQFCDLASLFRRADLISLHLPGGTSTHHLINAEILAQAQPHALLVNTGRGSTVDEAALIAALQKGQLAGAALDVYEHEPQVPAALKSLPNVVLAPHLGSATVETRRAMGFCCLDNIQAALNGQRPPQALNAL